MSLTVGSLFSGIGGLDLGLERAGMEVRWQCEIDPYCRKVLAKHWPNVPCYEDVRSLPDDIEPVDLICGGYPCQPFSFAGVRRGEADPRHLWPAMRDCVRKLRPRFVLIENVPGHLSLGFDRVLGDLAALGFDAEWSLLSACALGASHRRDRLFALAYPAGGHGADYMPHHFGQAGGHESRGGSRGAWGDGWLPEPEMGRVAHGVPSWMVRGPLESLGNAVVPQVAEMIGARLLETIGANHAH